ncbi:trimeric intracellular cation channel family protein [Sandaracinobacteroides sp. A072]|uniref:trimeric intracellular cation channel family protein n=1 Tax=Sandaracinobacteroides sp. A072 TaxID=3461146 RepID=UPI0040433772
MNGEIPAELRQALIWLDFAGVALFAITGALVAARARQDIITLGFFAGLTGIGGGTVRDLLIGAPVFWMWRPGYLETCLAVAVVVWLLRTEHWPERVLLWLDAMGLAAFTAFGAIKALGYGVPPIPAMVMGVITATLGGMLRDVMAGRPSVLMMREIYVTAAVVGAGATVLLSLQGLGTWPAGLAGAALAFLIRGGAIAWGWKLPVHRG